MGNSLNKAPQILMVGPENSGKTTLLFAESVEEIRPTQGYNLVEKQFADANSAGRKLSIWDVSGKDILKPLWSSYYKNILFSGVIFVIDPDDNEKFDTAIRDLHFLTNEEELRDCAFLVLLNKKNSATDRSEERNFDDAKRLEIMCMRQEIHINTRINFFEFDFKGYNNKSKDAFEWLNSNII